MQWYYSKNGTQLGPVEQGELIAKLTSGEVAPSDLVWREGMLDWLPAGQIAELRNLLAPAGYPQAPGMGQGPLSPYAPPTAGQQVSNYGGANIPNYLWQSIVVTVFCCWPFGIPAIIFAAKVDGLKSRGDLAGAQAASASAKTWCWVAFGCGLLAVLAWLAFVGVGVMSGSRSF
jgi:hypothetical protein